MERTVTIVIYWDNIIILRTIDDLQRSHGGGAAWSRSGRDLMIEIGGLGAPADQTACAGFLQELLIARDAGLLTFDLMPMPNGVPPPLDP